MDKQIVICSYNGTLLKGIKWNSIKSNKKELITDIYNNMDGSQNHAVSKKPDLKK